MTLCVEVTLEDLEFPSQGRLKQNRSKNNLDDLDDTARGGDFVRFGIPLAGLPKTKSIKKRFR